MYPNLRPLLFSDLVDGLVHGSKLCSSAEFSLGPSSSVPGLRETVVQLSPTRTCPQTPRQSLFKACLYFLALLRRVVENHPHDQECELREGP